MKNFNIVFLLCIIYVVKINAQDFINQRFDRQFYLTAYQGVHCKNLDSLDLTLRRGVIMDFQDDTLKMYPIDTFINSQNPTKLSVNLLSTQICDRTGRFLAHFNGRYLTDRFFNKIELDIFRNIGFGYGNMDMIGGATILPMPGSDNEYILIGANDYEDISSTGVRASQDISWVRFSASSTGTLQVIDQKKDNFKSKYFTDTPFSVCRHANGRDWWIVAPERDNNFFHFFLLSPEGFTYSHNQRMAEIFSHNSCGSNFSPQGNYYNRVYKIVTNVASTNYGQIFRFDRCNGSFEEPITINVPYNGTLASILQIIFEPNERYFYMNLRENLWQGDITQSNIMDSLHLFQYDVNTIDHSNYPGLGFSLLAPDGKVYIMDFNNRFKSSVVHKPTLKGEACAFEYGSVVKPSCSMMVEMVPHFGLGPVDGSTCDTLNLNASMSLKENMHKKTFISYPNPSTGLISFNSDANFSGRIKIYNLFGQIIFDEKYSSKLTADLNAYKGLVIVQWTDIKGDIIHVSKHLIVN